MGASNRSVIIADPSGAELEFGASGGFPVEIISGNSGSSSSATNFAFYAKAEDATYKYVGKQSANGKWYIMRIHKTTGVATYAVGDSDMATAWSSFATQDYDVWDNHNQATATIAEATNVTVSNPTADPETGLAKDVTFSNIIEARTQTPTKANAINVQIGPGDPISNIPVVMDFEHHQVHEGESYVASDEQLTLGTGTVKYEIAVPAGKYPHIVCLVDCYDGSALVRKIDNVTASGGSLVAAFNRNRNSANTPGTTVKTGVTSTDGTRMMSFFAGASRSTGGSGRAQTEFIGKPNTKYRFEVIGQFANTKAVVNFEWYEDLSV